MCGRFTLTKTARQITEAFSVSEPPNWQPKYNIAPTDWVLALVKSGSDHPCQYRLCAIHPRLKGYFIFNRARFFLFLITRQV